MDFSLISLSDATSLLEMYEKAIPKDPQQIYNEVYDLLSQLSPGDPLPVGIQDLYIAQGLYDIIEYIPEINLSDILLSRDDDLIDLATDLGLPEVDKERIIRILGYIGKLENDTSFIDTLPIEIVEEIAVNLDCKSLFLLCKVSKKFNGLCNNKHILKRIIRDKGYQGNLQDTNTGKLKSLCRVLESGKFVPREAYVIDDTNDKIIKMLDNIVQVSVGVRSYLFLTADMKVYGVGSNTEGQLGLPEFKYYSDLQLIPGLDNIKQVAAGIDHTLCLSFDGEVYGFGSRDLGQLGELHHDPPNNNIPKRIPGLNNIKQIAAGLHYSLCLREDGRVYAFGYNSSGQLGLGHKNFVFVPKLVPNINNIKQVSASEHHSLCLREDGKVYVFGNNSYGQLGVSNIKETSKAILISDINNIVQVSAGDIHSLFLRDDGRLYVTGGNLDQELGISKEKKIFTPKLVPKPKNIVQVSAGTGKSMFLTKYGQLYIYKHGREMIQDLNEIVDRKVPVIYEDATTLNEVISAGRGFTNNNLVLI